MNQLFLTTRVFQNIYFFIPIIVLYAQHIGLNLAQLFIIESIFTLIITFIDIPLGHLTDKISAKYALFVGASLQALACLSLYILPSPLTFVLTQIAFAFAIGVTRGSDSAYNLALLKSQNDEKEFRASENRFMRFLLVAEAISYLAGGYLALQDIKLPFLLTTIFQIFAAVLILFCPNLKTEAEQNLNWSEKYTSLQTILTNSKGHRFFVFAIIAMGCAFTTILYIAPVAINQKGADYSQIGYIFAFASIMAAIIGKLSSKWNLKQVYLLVFGLFGFLCFIIPTQFTAVLGFVLIKYVQTEFYPFFKEQLAKEFKHLGYATVMSFFGTSLNIGFAILSPFIGLVGDHLGLNSLLVSCALFFLIGAFYFFKNLSIESDKLKPTQIVGS
jgi:predicted MFS family arabinose efflux permease